MAYARIDLPTNLKTPLPSEPRTAQPSDAPEVRSTYHCTRKEDAIETAAIRVSIVDDHESVRLGLSTALATMDGIRVVGEATNGGETLLLSGTVRPDVILMEIRLPNQDGIGAIQLIRQQNPGIQVVVRTTTQSADLRQRAEAAGASRYLQKLVATESIGRAIRGACAARITDEMAAPRPGPQTSNQRRETRSVFLAAGRPRRVSPNRILGKDIFWWIDRLGILRASRDSAIGRYLMRTDPFPGKDLEIGRLQKRGVTVVGRLSEVAGRQATFACGEVVGVDVVIWATGYRDDSAWVEIPKVKDEREAFVRECGLSPVPDLTFIGRSRQSTRGSALLTGVGADAAVVARHFARTIESPSGLNVASDPESSVALAQATSGDLD